MIPQKNLRVSKFGFSVLLLTLVSAGVPLVARATTAPTISIEASRARLLEGDGPLAATKITVRRSGGDSSKKWVVGLKYEGSAAGDPSVGNKPTSVTIQPGATVTTFDLSVDNNNRFDVRRYLNVQIIPGTAYEISPAAKEAPLVIDDLSVNMTFPDLDEPLHSIDGISYENGGGPDARLSLRLPDNVNESAAKVPLCIYFSGGSGAVKSIGAYQWAQPLDTAGFCMFGFMGQGYAMMNMSTFKGADTFGIEENDGELNARNWNAMLDTLKAKYPKLPIDWSRVVVLGYSNGGRAISAVASDNFSSPTAATETDLFLNRLSGIFEADGSQLTTTGAKRIGLRGLKVGLVSLVSNSYMAYDQYLLNKYGATALHWDGNGSAVSDHGLSTYDPALSPELRDLLDTMMAGGPVKPNEAPTVVLTGPSASISVAAGAIVSLSANAQDVDGQIAKVEFLKNGVLIGSCNTAPYQLSFSTTGLLGAQVITAKATDNFGMTSTSVAQTVTVVAPKNVLPIVQLLPPSEGGTVTQGAMVTLTAFASDADGSIKKVEFYNGSTLIDSVTSGPYKISLNTSMMSGQLLLSARAFDDAGAFSVSNTVTLKIVPGNLDSMVSLYGPAVVLEGKDNAFSVNAPTSYQGKPLVKVGLFRVSGRKMSYVDTAVKAPWDLVFHPYTAREFVLKVRVYYGTGDAQVAVWSLPYSVNATAK